MGNAQVDNILSKYQHELRELLETYAHTKIAVYEDGSTSVISANISILDKVNHISSAKTNVLSKGSRAHASTTKNKKSSKVSSSSRRVHKKKKKKEAAKSDLLSLKDWLKLLHNSRFLGSKSFSGISEHAAKCIFLFAKSNV